MKFNILINQKIIAERFPTLTLKDAALLAFLGDCFTSPSLKKFPVDGKIYTWIKSQWICQEMPLLGATTVHSMSKRLKILRDVGLIETTVLDGQFAVHCPGPRWDELSGISGGVSQNGDTCVPEPRHLWPETATPVSKGPNHDDPSMKHEEAPPAPEGVETKAKVPRNDHEDARHWPEPNQQSLSFIEALGNFCKVRRERKNSITPHAMELLRNKLLRYDLAIQIQALSESAENGWTGCFPERLKDAVKGGSGFGRKKTGTDEPALDFGF